MRFKPHAESFKKKDYPKPYIVDTLSTYVQSFEAATSVDDLMSLFQSMMKPLSLTHFHYCVAKTLSHQDRDSDLVFMETADKKWQKAYKLSKYGDKDPLMAFAKTHYDIFSWQDFINHPEPQKTDKHFIQLLQQQNVSYGLSIPILGLKGKSGVFNVGFGPDAMILTHSDRSILQWSLQIAHKRYQELVSQGSHGQDTLLTALEKSVAALMITGQTDREIAQALRMTEGEVARHVQTIITKTESDDRMDASLTIIAHNLTSDNS